MTRRRIVIAEFMDDAAVATLHARHDTLYDPKLVERSGDLMTAVATAEALIVRNRTQVDPASGSTTSTSRPARRAESKSFPPPARMRWRSPNT